MSVNVVALSGNVGQDPDLRATSSGTQVLSFSLCVSESVKVNDEWTERPNWVGCVVFGKRAESLARIVTKGMPLTVSGRLRYSSWDAPDGTRRSKLEVVCDQVQLPPRKASQASQGAPMSPAEFAQGVAQVAAGAPPAPELYDDAIPF